MCAMKTPPVMTLTTEEVQAMLGRVEQQVESTDYQIVSGMAATIQCVSELLDEKDVSAARLRQILFGAKSERKNKVFPKDKDGAPKDSETASGTGETEGGTGKRKGHGRNGASDYAGAQRIPVPHQGLSTGCTCTGCQRGKMYRMAPGQIVSFRQGCVTRGILAETEAQGMAGAVG